MQMARAFKCTSLNHAFICWCLQGLFPAVSAAVSSVLPLSDLAYIGYAHAEADECGGMNAFLEVVGGD